MTDQPKPFKRIKRFSIMPGKIRASRAVPWVGELPPAIAEAKARLIADGIAPYKNGMYVMMTADGDFFI